MVGGAYSTLVVSGEEEGEFAKVEDVLTELGAVKYLGPDVKAAARFDLTALASIYGMFGGAFLGMGLLKKQGHREGKMADAIKEGVVPFLTALVPYLGMIAEAWDEKRWGDNMGNPLGMQVQGIKNILEGYEDKGVDSGLLKELAEVMERAAAEFGGDVGVQVVGKLIMKDEE
jgi:hypothetical protein